MSLVAMRRPAHYGDRRCAASRRRSTVQSASLSARELQFGVRRACQPVRVAAREQAKEGEAKQRKAGGKSARQAGPCDDMGREEGRGKRKVGGLHFVDSVELRSRSVSKNPD